MPRAVKVTLKDVEALRQRRIPSGWRAYGQGVGCGLVLLPGRGTDYGMLPSCPWCLPRERGWRLPSVERVLQVLAAAGVEVELSAIDATQPEPLAPLSLEAIEHHPHDYSWLRRQLEPVDPAHQQDLLRGYQARYRAAYAAECSPNRREGSARWAANTWVREQLTKLGYRVTQEQR